MSTSTEAASKNAGLATVIDTIASPADAFTRLRAVPTWGWAYIVTVILSALGAYLSIPATIHAMTASWPAQVAANPQLATATPEQQQRALDFAVAVIHYAWVFTPVTVLAAAALQTLILLVFKAAGKGDATFKQLFCLSMNTLVVGIGVYTLLAGILAVVRGPAAYNSISDAMHAVPSLAWLVPHASVKLAAFLAAFNMVAIWGAALIAIGMATVARVSKANAYASGVTVTVLAGLYFALTAR